MVGMETLKALHCYKEILKNERNGAWTYFNIGNTFASNTNGIVKWNLILFNIFLLIHKIVKMDPLPF
jgi:hypothetical protein